MIYVECDTDEALVKGLDIPRKDIEHRSGKSSICKKLENSSSAKGLVDEDPSSVQPPYIKRSKLLSNRNDIKLLYDKNANNYVIYAVSSTGSVDSESGKRGGSKNGKLQIARYSRRIT